MAMSRREWDRGIAKLCKGLEGPVGELVLKAGLNVVTKFSEGGGNPYGAGRSRSEGVSHPDAEEEKSASFDEDGQGKADRQQRLESVIQRLIDNPSLLAKVERLLADGDSPDTADDGADDYAELRGHYQRFSEVYDRQGHGMTEEKLLDGFKKERARRPGLTADEYLGRQAR
jgi:hypothetical protein